MKEVQILGQILDEARMSQGCEKRDVYEGICSVAAYARFEDGKREPDKIIFEALLQRLGKSADQFEAVLGEEEYQYILLKEKIEDALFEGDEETVLKLKKEMEEDDLQNNVQLQYLHMIDGLLAYQRGDYVESAKILKKAYEVTANDKLLFHQEYLIRLMQHEVNRELGIEDDILEELYRYCITKVTDSRELVKLLPKTVESMAVDLSGKKEWNKVYRFTQEAIDLLAQEGELLCYLELLEHQRDAVCELGMEGKEEELQRKIGCLNRLYRENGCVRLTRMQRLLRTSIRTEYYLMSEYFRNNRVLMGRTQEEMEEVSVSRHIRRIEAGDFKSVQTTFDRLQKVLDNDRKRVTSYLSAQSFRELELNAKYAADASRRNYESLDAYARELRRMRHPHRKQFKQVMGRREIVLKLRKAEMTHRQAIVECGKLLKLTQPYYTISKIRYMEMNRAETELLNQMALSYRCIGKTEVAERIWKEALHHFNSSRIDNCYHLAQMILFISNLTGLLETENHFDEAIQWCEYGIKLSLKCGWGNAIQGFLTQKGYSLERKYENRMTPKMEKTIISYYAMACILSELMKDDFTSEFLKKYLKENFTPVLL